MMENVSESDHWVSLRNVSVTYGRRRRRSVEAVKDVSLDLVRGSGFGVIGESGSGKSSLGRVLAGVANPTTGVCNYRFRGTPEPPVRSKAARVQMITQDPRSALDPRWPIWRSVAEAVEFSGRRTVQRKAASEAAVAALEEVGLGIAESERRPGALSGGQLQRATIARALMARPEALLCDEITSALDVSTQAGIVELLLALKNSFHLSYVFISHDLAVVSGLVDRIAVMFAGRIVEIADTEDLIERPIHPYTQELVRASSSEALLQENQTLEQSRVSVVRDETQTIGCPYRDRCQNAGSDCGVTAPTMVQVTSSRGVACFHPLVSRHE